MAGWFKRAKWRRQLDALVQHANSREDAEAKMALDLSKLNDQSRRVNTVMAALVDVVTSQSATIRQLTDKISAMQAAPVVTTDPADQAAVDAAADALAAAAITGEAVAPRDPPTTGPSS
jgi:chromosome segregation ATPase